MAFATCNPPCCSRSLTQRVCRDTRDPSVWSSGDPRLGRSKHLAPLCCSATTFPTNWNLGSCPLRSIWTEKICIHAWVFIAFKRKLQRHKPGPSYSSTWGWQRRLCQLWHSTCRWSTWGNLGYLYQPEIPKKMYQLLKYKVQGAYLNILMKSWNCTFQR
jgi:hypothetical protein